MSLGVHIKKRGAEYSCTQYKITIHDNAKTYL